VRVLPCDVSLVGLAGGAHRGVWEGALLAGVADGVLAAHALLLRVLHGAALGAGGAADVVCRAAVGYYVVAVPTLPAH
jgi:hypothetical protein